MSDPDRVKLLFAPLPAASGRCAYAGPPPHRRVPAGLHVARRTAQPAGPTRYKGRRRKPRRVGNFCGATEDAAEEERAEAAGPGSLRACSDRTRRTKCASVRLLQTPGCLQNGCSGRQISPLRWIQPDGYSPGS